MLLQEGSRNDCLQANYKATIHYKNVIAKEKKVGSYSNCAYHHFLGKNHRSNKVQTYQVVVAHLLPEISGTR